MVKRLLCGQERIKKVSESRKIVTVITTSGYSVITYCITLK